MLPRYQFLPLSGWLGLILACTLLLFWHYQYNAATGYDIPFASTICHEDLSTYWRHEHYHATLSY